jgi:hypothetical protein
MAGFPIVYASIYGGAYETFDTHSVQCESPNHLPPSVWGSVRNTGRTLKYEWCGSHDLETSIIRAYWKTLRFSWGSGASGGYYRGLQSLVGI